MGPWDVGQKRRLTTMGFEPTPVKIGALIQRLRPLGHVVMTLMVYDSICTYNEPPPQFCMDFNYTFRANVRDKFNIISSSFIHPRPNGPWGKLPRASGPLGRAGGLPAPLQKIPGQDSDLEGGHSPPASPLGPPAHWGGQGASRPPCTRSLARTVTLKGGTAPPHPPSGLRPIGEGRGPLGPPAKDPWTAPPLTPLGPPARR